MLFRSNVNPNCSDETSSPYVSFSLLHYYNQVKNQIIEMFNNVDISNNNFDDAIKIINPYEFIFSKVLPIPSDSILSVVSRIPAVSINRKRIPSKVISSSIVSRVVPGISETMARSSLSSALSKVDLPAFGRPAITVFTPVLITLPSLKDSISGLSSF